MGNLFEAGVKLQILMFANSFIETDYPIFESSSKHNLPNFFPKNLYFRMN